MRGEGTAGRGGGSASRVDLDTRLHPMLPRGHPRTNNPKSPTEANLSSLSLTRTCTHVHTRPQAALRAANILPSKSNTYKVSELADAVEDMYGARPVIHCYNKQLSEVRG